MSGQVQRDGGENGLDGRFWQGESAEKMGLVLAVPRLPCQ
jgi:hypothetical protein